jgi:hypothetical protein
VVKPVAEKKLTEHVHCAEPATATLLVGQLVQVALAAAAEKVLARHERHRPETHCEPARQLLQVWQELLPAVGLYVLTGHGVHEPPEHALPAAHELQLEQGAVVVKPEAEKKPVLHVHWVEPTAALAVIGQLTHEVLPAAVL